MSPLSGIPPGQRPFSIEIGADLKEGDVRFNLIRHLKHALEGVLPAEGELKTKLLWAEIGVVFLEHNKADMAWICLPNPFKIKKNFEVNYRAAIAEIKAEKWNFSYHKHTTNLYGQETNPCHDKLLESPFITITSSSLSASNGILDTYADLASVSDKAVFKKNFSDWINNVWRVFQMGNLSHTFFVILQPGSFFHNEVNNLKENMIGSCLLMWDDDKPPHPQAILSLRRNIINTLGIEFGNILKFLKLSGIVAFQIPKLIEFIVTNKSFNNMQQLTHNDTNFSQRRDLCKIISASTSGSSVCDDCPTPSVEINKKVESVQGTHETTDFCGNLSQYKAMFEYYPNVFRKNPSPVSSCLFSKTASFFALDIEHNLKNPIVLPYTPAWLFLATIKILVDTLTRPKVKLERRDNKWHMNIKFAVDESKPRPSGPNYATELQERINNNNPGDVSSAILNVLHGKLPALEDYFKWRFPNNKYTETLSKGHRDKLMDCTICQKNVNYEKSLIVEFSWESS